MKATTRHKISVADVLPFMVAGEAHSLLELAKRTRISRGLLNILLDNGINSQKIVKRTEAKNGRPGAVNRRIVYYIAGTEPKLPERVRLPGAALPITVHAATVTGSIDAYAKSLRDRVALAMLTRTGHHYVGGAS